MLTLIASLMLQPSSPVLSRTAILLTAQATRSAVDVLRPSPNPAFWTLALNGGSLRE